MGSPRSFAHSSLAKSTQDAPSVSGVEFPAVNVPFTLSKAGFNLANFSIELSFLRLLSLSNPLKGVIISSKKPSS
ncbi:hypothetical protein D3C87_1714570 [compost metagenome]